MESFISQAYPLFGRYGGHGDASFRYFAVVAWYMDSDHEEFDTPRPVVVFLHPVDGTWREGSGDPQILVPFDDVIIEYTTADPGIELKEAKSPTFPKSAG